MNKADRALEIATRLLERPSVSPADGGCQDYLARLLEALGFRCHRLPYGEVSNLWAVRGTAKPLFAYLGHTDVVPPGDPARWRFPPFEPTIHDDALYGRGSADMKGSVACFVSALHDFIAQHPDHPGSIGVLLTSDEESLAIDGIRRVVSDHFAANDIQIDYCLVGEPTSEQHPGDTIKNGRRGSLNGYLTVFGKQGHIAYPHLAENPADKTLPALAALQSKQWDRGNKFFEPTRLQISNVNAGTGAANVIPEDWKVAFNIRFNTEHTFDSLKQQVRDILDEHNAKYKLKWELNGAPFLAGKEGRLVHICQQEGRRILGRTPALSTSGGTSDGRFIAPTGAETIEFGGLSTTIHQVDEHITLEEISVLADLYHGIIKAMVLQPAAGDR